MINKFKILNIIYILVLVLVDVLVLILSLKTAIYFEIHYLQNYIPNLVISDIKKYYWIILITLLIFSLEKIYFIRYDFWSDTKRILKSLIYSFITVFTVITLTKMSLEYSRIFIIVFYIICIILIPISKRLFKRILFKFDVFKLNVKILGNSVLVDKMKKEIEYNWYFGYKINERKYDLIIILSKNLAVEKLQKLIKRYSKRTRNIYVVPYMYHLDFTHTNVVDYFNIRLSAIHIENRLLNFKNVLIKYISEKLMVFCLLPFALFLHLFISILIKFDSKGNVFFKQKRFGKDGKTFSCYKYRTMYINGKEILEEYLKNNPDEIEYYKLYHKYENDPRITKVGRILRLTSMDEFPQFFNIFRGDMNLIGPRPYMLDEKKNIGKYNEDIILRVKPGITGLWQVSGRNELPFEERIELDKWYIQNWSLWMDFVIFVKTLKVVLTKVGAK